MLLVVFALLTRVVWASINPPALNWDEASHGYNAYSILTTGKDEWGISVPSIFRAFGDYKLPVYIYAATPFIFLFGNTELAVRLPSMLAGVGLVMVTYLLAVELYAKSTPKGYKKIALFAAILVTIEPWSFFASRAALEANLAAFLVVTGVYLFLKFVNFLPRARAVYFFIAAIMVFGLSAWTYNSSRVFVPLLLCSLLLIYRNKVFAYFRSNKAFAALGFLFAALFFVPMFVQLSSTPGSARYENVQILSDGAVAKIEEARNNSELNPFIVRLIHNRPAYFATQFVRNYVSHFSPQFLFLEGGSHYQFNIPDHGLLYLLNLPLVVAGFILVVVGYKRKESRLLLAWILLAPVASSVTSDSPHALRSLVMIPVPMVLAAIGGHFIFNILKKSSVLLVFYSLALLAFFAAYINLYSNDYREKYSWAWQYGYKQAVEIVKENYDEYEKIIFTKKYGEPHIFLLYYWPWSPEAYNTDEDKIRFYQSNWYWVDKFDKFYFVNDWQIPKSGNSFVLESGSALECGKCLLVTSPQNAPVEWQIIETIYFLDGKPAFEIYEN